MMKNENAGKTGGQTTLRMMIFARRNSHGL